MVHLKVDFGNTGTAGRLALLEKLPQRKRTNITGMLQSMHNIPYDINPDANVVFSLSDGAKDLAGMILRKLIFHISLK